MLSFKFVTSAAGAAHYFETSDDYYGKEGHRGEWVGQSVIHLGLDGALTIERDTFQNLLDGQLPGGQRMRLSQTKGSKDRKGIDFTFSAPKSVSIQALVKGDERIVAAHDAAVKKSLELMQGFAATRKKQGGLSFRNLRVILPMSGKKSKSSTAGMRSMVVVFDGNTVNSERQVMLFTSRSHRA